MVWASRRERLPCQALRKDGSGHRHFWHYIDAKTHKILDNRFEIARMISCQPDEPRYIGDQDVFVLQDKVIEHILKNEREREAQAATAASVDPSQQTVREELRNAIQRGTVDRDATKAAIRFLGQPVGKFAIKRLKAAYKQWGKDRDDGQLLETVQGLAMDYAKDDSSREVDVESLGRDDLKLICFEYVSS